MSAAVTGSGIRRGDRPRAGRRVLVRKMSSAALLCCFLVLAAALVLPHAGVRLLTVQSGSMAPRFPIGTLVVERQVPTDELHAGTVISFYPPDRDTLVTHRIVAVDRTRGGTIVTTRGDANQGDDPWRAELIGRRTWVVTGGLPGLGRAADLLHSPVAAAALSIGLPLIFLMSTVLVIWRRRPTGPSPIRGLPDQPAPGQLPYPRLYRAGAPVRRHRHRPPGRPWARRLAVRTLAVLLVTGAVVGAGAIRDPASARFTASTARGHAISTAALLAPTLTATNACFVTGSYVSLSWTANGTGETTYRIERMTPLAAYSTLTTVPASTRTYRDSALVGLGTYSYRVTAVRGTWSSPTSNVRVIVLAGICG